MRKTAAQLDREISATVPAWQRGLDMSTSRELAMSLNNQAARDDARRAEARERARGREVGKRATIKLEGTRVVVTTAKHTGEANAAWRALKDAKLHIWHTEPGRIEIVGGRSPAETQARVVAALMQAGFRAG